MAGHNFIRNEVFDENADRLNELTRFVMTQRKTAEYEATRRAESTAERHNAERSGSHRCDSSKDSNR